MLYSSTRRALSPRALRVRATRYINSSIYMMIHLPVSVNVSKPPKYPCGYSLEIATTTKYEKEAKCTRMESTCGVLKIFSLSYTSITRGRERWSTKPLGCRLRHRRRNTDTMIEGFEYKYALQTSAMFAIASWTKPIQAVWVHASIQVRVNFQLARRILVQQRVECPNTVDWATRTGSSVVTPC